MCIRDRHTTTLTTDVNYSWANYFVRSCLHHESSIVSSVAWYSILHGRYRSPTGRNVSLCPRRYLLHAWWSAGMPLFFHIVSCYVSASYTTDQCTVASLLSECLLVREGTLKLPVCFLHSDIRDFIVYLSTSWCLTCFNVLTCLLYTSPSPRD